MPDNKKDDRKAGLPALNLRSAGAYGGASSVGGGAGSGGGLAGALATAGGKAGVVLVLAALGAGGYGLSRVLVPGSGGDGAGRYWRVGAERPAALPALSAKPSAPAAAPESSGLGMVSGSLDDRTAAQRAADEAAKAQTEAKAAEEAKASANATPSAAAGSLTAQAGGPKASPFKTKFGALSHGGSGGSGSGPFAALNGGSAAGGGLGLGFDRQLSAPKNFSASRGKPAAQSALMARSGARGRGFAYRQLGRASGLSRQGAAASGETSSALADQAFNNHPIGAAAPIGGGGAMGATTGAGVTQSGPLNGPTNSLQQQPTQAPPTAEHKDVTPWGAQAKLATMLLTIAGVALLMAHLLAMAAKKWPVISSWAFPLAKFLAVTAAGLGAAAAALGILMMKQGQMMYGAIFTGGGALISVLAVKALVDDSLEPDKALHGYVGSATDKAQWLQSHNLPMPSGSPPGIDSTAGQWVPGTTVDGNPGWQFQMNNGGGVFQLQNNAQAFEYSNPSVD